MNLIQKLILCVGALLIFLRCFFPIKKGILVDFPLTLLHIIGVAVVSTALFFSLQDISPESALSKFGRKIIKVASKSEWDIESLGIRITRFGMIIIKILILLILLILVVELVRALEET